jgi:FtsP/CotA-like multicopper oxidase with cupredoxin domain
MTHRTRRLGLLLAAFAIAMFVVVLGTASALPAGFPKVGMVCTPGTAVGGTHTFNLVTNTGYIDTPDGNSVFMWSYANHDAPDNDNFQSPGPVLCVTEGETVVVNLRNTLPEPASIVFPGQDSAVTATGGAPGLFTTEAAAGGGTVSYTFTAESPGTYLYESGSDITKQVEMGLYGALVVRPNTATCPAVDGTNCAYGASTRFTSSREFLQLLAEIDPDLHHAVETGGEYDFTALRNHYFTINGRSFPDTVQDNGSALQPNQPYGALVRIQPNTAVNTQPALIRMINAGADNHPFHPHGNHTTEIAQDGRVEPRTEHFGETIGAGQTKDYLLRWDDVDQWTPGSNPFPVDQPNYRNLTFKDSRTWYSGTPYLGYKGTLPTGTTSLNVCGEWYFPFHSHALDEFSNFDEGFGGMGTLLRVDPAGGCFTFPSSTKITSGTLNSGSVGNLSVDDANYYKVNSTTSGTRTTDWYGQFSGIGAGSTNLKVTYKGNDAIVQPAPTTQDFNTLASTGTTGTTLPTGWQFFESGTGANTSYGVNNGSSATANTYSYGSTGSTDRAFGVVRGTGTGGTVFNTFVGSVFTNATGATITSLAINYTGEQWRKAGNGADSLHFEYSLQGGANLGAGIWNAISANPLDFTSPQTSAGAVALNGNAAANRTSKSFTITGLSIAPGATYRIRWSEPARATAHDGLAVDDFSIAPAIDSQTFPTTVSIWNWSTSQWTQLAGPAVVGNVDVTVADNQPVDPSPAAGSWSDYIGTGSNKGLLRVRVLTTGGTANFVTGGNLMKLVYDAP